MHLFFFLEMLTLVSWVFSIYLTCNIYIIISNELSGCGWRASAASRGGRGQCLRPGRTGWWSLFIRRGTGGCGITLLSLSGKVYAKSSADSRTSDSGGTVRSCNTGPALFPFQGAGGLMGVCPTNPHVFCGFGEGIRLCPSRRPVGGALGVWGPGPVAKGCPVPVRPEQELDSHCRQ